MADQEPHPLTQHILQMAAGRQQGELAKISILGELLTINREMLQELKALREVCAELVERTKGK